MVRSADHNVLLLYDHEGRVVVPKGHVERHESPIETALRELSEETGLPARFVRIDAAPVGTYREIAPSGEGDRPPKNVTFFLGYLVDPTEGFNLRPSPAHIRVGWHSLDSMEQLQRRFKYRYITDLFQDARRRLGLRRLPDVIGDATKAR